MAGGSSIKTKIVMEIMSFTGKNMARQEKVFGCFDFSNTVTHGSCRFLELMTEFKLT